MRKAELEQDYKWAHAYHDRWKPIFAQALRNGSKEPTQLPHPAHIKRDVETGQFIICGPTDRRMKIAWEWLKLSLRNWKLLMNKLKAWLTRNPGISVWRAPLSSSRTC